MPNLAQKILSCSATESAESRSFSFLWSSQRGGGQQPLELVQPVIRRNHKLRG